MTEVQTAAAATLPSTIATSFQGTAQAFQDSLQGLGLILIMAIVVIYIVLGILYESFTHPLTILSGLPSAGFGALLTLLIFKTELSLYAFVGIIMLVGLVKKNGIMMVDFAVEAQREHGKTPLEAIHEACLVRFRPIMMTTMAALVGTLPIALGLGAGAESRRPLGLAVVGGLLVSQLLTLYITPVYYVYIEGARLWLDLSGTLLSPDQAKVSSEVAGVVREVPIRTRNRSSGGRRAGPPRAARAGTRARARRERAAAGRSAARHRPRAGQAAAARRADRLRAPGGGQPRRCARGVRAGAAAQRPRTPVAGGSRHRRHAAEGRRGELSGDHRHGARAQSQLCRTAGPRTISRKRS